MIMNPFLRRMIEHSDDQHGRLSLGPSFRALDVEAFIQTEQAHPKLFIHQNCGIQRPQPRPRSPVGRLKRATLGAARPAGAAPAAGDAGAATELQPCVVPLSTADEDGERERERGGHGDEGDRVPQCERAAPGSPGAKGDGDDDGGGAGADDGGSHVKKRACQRGARGNISWDEAERQIKDNKIIDDDVISSIDFSDDSREVHADAIFRSLQETRRIRERRQKFYAILASMSSK